MCPYVCPYVCPYMYVCTYVYAGDSSGDGAKHAGVVSQFELFAREQQETLLLRQPHASFQEVLSVAGQAWRSLR